MVHAPVQNPTNRENDALSLARPRLCECKILINARTSPPTQCTLSYGSQQGWVAEWFKAPVLKTGVPKRYRGFESLPNRY